VPGPPEIRPAVSGTGGGQFPLGAAATTRELDDDPHPLLRRLREREPVSWLPVLGGWLVTRRDIALRVMLDSELFTVDDPRFTTARVVGPSMLSLDGVAHSHHRDPFSQAFRVAAVRDRLEAFVRAEADRLVTVVQQSGNAELRRSLAGPLAVAVVAEVLGLDETEPSAVLAWYDAIVGAVSALAEDTGSSSSPAGRWPGDDARAGDGGSAGAGDGVGDGVRAGGGDGVSVAGARAFGLLTASLEAAIACPGRPSLLAAAAGDGGLTTGEAVSNAAVLMFGGIETTEGMISNAVLHLLSHPDQLSLVIADPGLLPGAIEESLRLEPAAAVIDRYATADVLIGDAAIRRGDLVTVSLAGANRDPAFFPDPDRFDVRRENARLNLAFAHGSHFCLGAHLARVEADAAIRTLLSRLAGLRLDPARRSSPRGLVFRKPSALHVLWDVQ
jgi:cytochrome P450